MKNYFYKITSLNRDKKKKKKSVPHIIILRVQVVRGVQIVIFY